VIKEYTIIHVIISLDGNVISFLFVLQNSSTAHPWNSKISKMAQPDLDFIAPEIQLETTAVPTSDCDVFALALLVCSIYNDGHSLMRAGYNPSSYATELEKVRFILVTLHVVH